MTQKEEIREPHGLFRNTPRCLRRAIERRLAALETDADRFDREALVNFVRLKRLHALLHVQPGARARATFFGKPVPGSPRAALRELVQSRDDPRAAATLVRQYRIPYLLAEATLGTITPPVALALIETLDPEELIGRLPLMARRELLVGPVREALLHRLKELARHPSDRFSYAKIESVVRQANLDRQVAAAAFALIETGPRGGQLIGDLAMLVDVSSSMPREGSCIELAAAIAWRIDQALEEGARLQVYTASTEGNALAVKRESGLDQWRRVFTLGAPAAPGTSLGAALDRLAAEGGAVSRLVLVTDGYENRPPRFVSAYERYRSSTGRRPTIHLVQPTGAAQQLARDLKNAQIGFTVFTVDRHLLGLDAMIASLNAQASENRIDQILAFREPSE